MVHWDTADILRLHLHHPRPDRGCGVFGHGPGRAGPPLFVVHLFGTTALTRDGRNEVRAVYGGYGLAVAAILAAVELSLPAQRDGVLLAIEDADGAVRNALESSPGSADTMDTA